MFRPQCQCHSVSSRAKYVGKSTKAVNVIHYSLLMDLSYMIDKLTLFPQYYVIWLTSWHDSPIVMLYDWQADMIPSVLCYMIDKLTWFPQCYVIWLTSWHHSPSVMLYDWQADMTPSVLCYMIDKLTWLPQWYVILIYLIWVVKSRSNLFLG